MAVLVRTQATGGDELTEIEGDGARILDEEFTPIG